MKNIIILEIGIVAGHLFFVSSLCFLFQSYHPIISQLSNKQVIYFYYKYIINVCAGCIENIRLQWLQKVNENLYFVVFSAGVKEYL